MEKKNLIWPQFYFLEKQNPKITAQKLSSKVGISQRKIEENIHTLKEKGLIERLGSNKSGEWVVKLV